MNFYAPLFFYDSLLFSFPFFSFFSVGERVSFFLSCTQNVTSVHFTSIFFHTVFFMLTDSFFSFFSYSVSGVGMNGIEGMRA